MDQSALLSAVGGLYDKLVQDVSNRVYGMMLETERARQPADYGQLVIDVAERVNAQINYEMLADQIDWKSFASDIASGIDLGDLVTELDYSAIAEGLDVEKVADEIDMDEKVREVLRGL